MPVRTISDWIKVVRLLIPEAYMTSACHIHPIRNFSLLNIQDNIGLSQIIVCNFPACLEVFYDLHCQLQHLRSSNARTDIFLESELTPDWNLSKWLFKIRQGRIGYGKVILSVHFVLFYISLTLKCLSCEPKYKTLQWTTVWQIQIKSCSCRSTHNTNHNTSQHSWEKKNLSGL